MAIDLVHHHDILSSGSREAYQACVILATLVGGALIRQDATTWQVTSGEKWRILGVAFVGALIGCAIPAYFSGGLIEEIAWSVLIAPKTVMGGLLCAFLFVALYKRSAHIVFDTSDGFARGAIATMAIGRIGCIFQHCCYGREAGWGMDFGDGVTRIPVQYIEAVGLFLIFALINRLHTANRFTGRRLFLVFALYGGMRFLLEFLREPVADSYLGIGYYQWIALLVLSVGVWQIHKRRESLHRHPVMS
jgi:phosphatidylglycerol---prolipoprotein diacylglyceryl transferase